MVDDAYMACASPCPDPGRDNRATTANVELNDRFSIYLSLLQVGVICCLMEV